MSSTPHTVHSSAALVESVRQFVHSRGRPILVAVDGRSGTGKSTVAMLLAETLDAVVVPGDDFFAAEVTAAGWDARSPKERARDAIDWRRLRREALEPLLGGAAAAWRPFDFARGPRPDESYAMCTDVTRLAPNPIIILDGAYAARPELSDLVSLSILIESPAVVRRKRLVEREEPRFLEEWLRRWDAAEAHYFTQVRPPSSFDIVVTNG